MRGLLAEEKGKPLCYGHISSAFFGVAESGDDFTKFSTIYQWFQTLIHPLIQQRPFFLLRLGVSFINPKVNHLEMLATYPLE